MRVIIAAILFLFVVIAGTPAARAQSLTSDELGIYKQVIHRQYVLQRYQNQSPLDQNLDKIIEEVASGLAIQPGTVRDIYSRGISRPITEEEQVLGDRILEKVWKIPKDAPLEDYDRAIEPVLAEYGLTLEDEFELELRMMHQEHYGEPE